MLPRHAPLPLLSALSGVAVFAVMDAVLKRASIAADPYSVLLFRAMIGIVLMLPLWWFTGGRWPDRAALKLHALRGAVSAVMAWLFFWALVRLPLAEAIAISFIAPLIALYLASAMLGEVIGRRAVIGSLVAFAGVVAIAAARIGADGPGAGDGAALGVLAVLASAVLFAWNLVLQRRQALLASPQEVALFQNLFVALWLGLGAAWFAHVPAGPVFGDIALGALLGAVSLMLMSWAYRRAEAQSLVATEYTAFGWAALMGWLWFGEVVTPATVAGVALIVAGCWIASRQGASAPLT